MKLKSFIGHAAAAVLVGVGLLFAWAGSVRMAATRIPVGLFMVGAGIGIIYLVRRQAGVKNIQNML